MPPSDRGRIKNDLRARHRDEPRRLRIPLIPAHQDAELAARGLMRGEVEIAGSEIIFFVEARIVGDMHLAVAPGDLAAGINHDCGIVIDARRAPLEERRDNYNFTRARDIAQRVGRRPGNRLGQIEARRILGLTGVLRAKQLLQANHLRSARRRLLDTSDRLIKIAGRLSCTRHLHQPNDNFIARGSHRMILIAAALSARHSGLGP